MSERLKVLIADDHPLFRKALRQIIESDSRFEVVHEMENGEEVLTLLDEELPDIVVLDVDMPKLNGIEVARAIQKKELLVDVIFITMYKDEYMFNKAMDLGVRGYILKESAVSDITSGIRTVAEGKYYISPSISEYLVRRSGRSTTLPAHQRGIVDLTPTERRVLKLIAENKTSKEIAGGMSISPKTVERHRENISNKLNLHGAHTLLKFALENKHLF
jgi:DNA-binding NarL/FixJ family response regulator